MATHEKNPGFGTDVKPTLGFKWITFMILVCAFHFWPSKLVRKLLLQVVLNQKYSFNKVEEHFKAVRLRLESFYVDGRLWDGRLGFGTENSGTYQRTSTTWAWGSRLAHLELCEFYTKDVFSTNNLTRQLIPDASEPEPECTDSPSEKDTDSDWESLASLRVS